MTDKRLILALPLLTLLAACDGGGPAGDAGAASGEVLEGTISDAMLPVDRVRSEPPLEDPEAFARSRRSGSGTAASAGSDDDDDESAEGGQPADDGAGSQAPDEAAPE